MKEIDFLEKINNIDDDLLEAAMEAPVKRFRFKTQYLAVAASIFFIVGAALFMQSAFRKNTPQPNTLIAFAMEGNTYEVATLKTYIQYGFLPEASMQRSRVEFPMPTKDSLGKQLGTVNITYNGKSVECKVYFHADFPDDKHVCIIELPDETYQIYVLVQEVSDEE